MDKPQTARSYRATVLDDNAVVSINLKWLAQIGALLAMLVYGYWNMVTRITNLEQEVADADAQIAELVEKRLLADGVSADAAYALAVEVFGEINKCE